MSKNCPCMSPTTVTGACICTTLLSFINSSFVLAHIASMTESASNSLRYRRSMHSSRSTLAVYLSTRLPSLESAELTRKARHCLSCSVELCSRNEFCTLAQVIRLEKGLRILCIGILHSMPRSCIHGEISLTNMLFQSEGVEVLAQSALDTTTFVQSDLTKHEQSNILG